MAAKYEATIASEAGEDEGRTLFFVEVDLQSNPLEVKTLLNIDDDQEPQSPIRSRS